MAQYTVRLVTSISATLKVDADSPEAATSAALERAAEELYLCTNCTGWDEDRSMEIDGEWDVTETSSETPDAGPRGADPPPRRV